MIPLSLLRVADRQVMAVRSLTKEHDLYISSKPTGKYASNRETVKNNGRDLIREGAYVHVRTI